MEVSLIATNAEDAPNSLDLLVVNAARVSFGKRKSALDEADKKLLVYLAKNKHMVPFRHPQITLHIKCCDTVARQFMKHIVGGEHAHKDAPWSEISGRYIEYKSFEYPVLRKQAKNVKQGSSDEPAGELAQAIYKNTIDVVKKAYQELLDLDVCKEQARMLLPFATETEFWVTGSLEYWFHFVHLRKDTHAQKEIQVVANEVEKVCSSLAKYSWEALTEASS